MAGDKFMVVPRLWVVPWYTRGCTSYRRPPIEAFSFFLPLLMFSCAELCDDSGFLTRSCSCPVTLCAGLGLVPARGTPARMKERRRRDFHTDTGAAPLTLTNLPQCQPPLSHLRLHSLICEQNIAFCDPDLALRPSPTSRFTSPTAHLFPCVTLGPEIGPLLASSPVLPPHLNLSRRLTSTLPIRPPRSTVYHPPHDLTDSAWSRPHPHDLSSRTRTPPRGPTADLGPVSPSRTWVGRQDVVLFE